MSSELIGSFVRRGNFPIEANYIFPNELELINFYSDPILLVTLHEGLLKLVKDDGEGNLALYWVDENLLFLKLFTGRLFDSLGDLIQHIKEELLNLQSTNDAIWGTTNPSIIPEEVNSIIDLAEYVQELNNRINEFSLGGLKAIVNKAYYDASLESIIMEFNLDNGSTLNLSIPLTNLIREWEPDNNSPSKVVLIFREEVYSGGADKLSADIRISTNTDNILEKDGNSLLVRGTTDNIFHKGQSLEVIIKRLLKRIAALEEIIEQETVVPISIVSFETTTPLENEEGVTINPTFIWQYNIATVDLQTLNGTPISNSLRNGLINGINSDTTVTLFASYKGYTDSREIKFTFSPRIYYGSSELSLIVDVSQLSGNKLGIDGSTISYDCNGGKYAYYLAPSTYKDRITFWVSNLEVTSYTTSTLYVTNSDGKEVEYTLFKLDNKLYGQFNMEIKLK